MSDGYERPTSLAAAPLDVVSFEDPSCPLTVLPCVVGHLTGRFPTIDEGS